MNNLNLPIYRAKKIGSDEYVVGNYIKTQNKYYIYEDGTSDIYLDDDKCFDDGSIDGEIRIIDLIFEIDQTTLAIHFPDILDSQGNKIFASLSEDGKGGDIILSCEVEQITGTVIYDQSSIFINGGCSEYLSEVLQRKDKDFKVIGIQK